MPLYIAQIGDLGACLTDQSGSPTHLLLDFFKADGDPVQSMSDFPDVINGFLLNLFDNEDGDDDDEN